MTSLLLKIKSKNGQTVLNTIQPSTTLASLKTELSKITNIAPKNVNILSGFPPKPLDLTNLEKTVEASNINSGDTLIIEEIVGLEPPKNLNDGGIKGEVSESNITRRHISDSSMDVPGILLKKVVPADNSCLFTSIGFVLGGELLDMQA